MVIKRIPPLKQHRHKGFAVGASGGTNIKQGARNCV
jgi:hypothetical protein